MPDSADRIAHAANLLVCVGGLATATGVIAGTSAAVAGFLSWRELRKRLPDAVKPFAQQIEAEIRAKLDDPLQHLSPETRLLIPQMIAASLPTPADIIDSGMEATALVKVMLASLTEVEHKQTEHTVAFERIVTPLLNRLLRDPKFTQQLAPAFQRRVLEWLRDIANSLSELNESYGTLAKSLNHLEQLRASELQTLCLLFGLEQGYAAAPDEMIAALKLKAQ